jgi:hypothetical protein
MGFVLSVQRNGRILATDPKYLISDFTAIKEMNVNRYNALHEKSRLFPYSNLAIFLTGAYSLIISM